MKAAKIYIPPNPRAFLHGQDPTETWAAQDVRSAKALFAPSLKRDIVPSIAWTRPPTGGSHGNPHWTASIHSRVRRRGRRFSARGARAAAHVACREDQARVAALRQGQQEVGWTDGRNARIDIRWPAGGNTTGFSFVEYGICGKWPELLKRVRFDRAPRQISPSKPPSFNPPERFPADLPAAQGSMRVINGLPSDKRALAF
jgi:hypothetical protein